MERRSSDNDGGVITTIRGSLPSGRTVGTWVLALVMVFLAITAKGLIETKEPDDILVVQSIATGDLTFYTGTESWVWQIWGNTTAYKKRDFYNFDNWVEESVKDAEGKEEIRGKCTNGIEVRFNDGGHGTICGSIQFEMPLDSENLTKIHTKFKSQGAVKSALIETITGKSVFLSGTLMSSRESYAERRNDLLFYIDDQIQHGVYRTIQQEERVKDAITGAEKTAVIVKLVTGADGKPERQEPAVLEQFGIKSFNFTIKRMPYDNTVEGQIKEQQKITMDVQTAIADARKAEQRTLTVTEQGKADAAKARWEQETIKAREVTKAEQEKSVGVIGAEKDRDMAALRKEAASFYKQEQILKGEGDSANRRLQMQANGALEPKLEAWKAVMGKFAEEFGKQKWVPEVQMGGNGVAGVNAVEAMMGVLSTKALHDLGLDMKMDATKRVHPAGAE